jgi:hypothetical protein
MVTWKSESNLEEEGLELLVGAVHLVDEEHRRTALVGDRREQRRLRRNAFAEDVRLARGDRLSPSCCSRMWRSCLG